MSMEFGYIVKLDDVAIDDNNQSWIMAMPHGTYQHPVYGEIKLNEKRSKKFADNVKNNVRGQQLDIDYDHKKRVDHAAGWVQAAEARPDGLYLQVEWTESAAKQIKAKEYRYFSPEFTDEWEHPATGQVYEDVLFGGGITNRPFLKGISPLNLSEYSDQAESEGGMEMDRKALTATLGLAEDASDEDINAKLAELLARPEKAEPVTPQLTDTKSVIEAAEGSTDPVVLALAEKLKNAEVQLAANTASLKLAEVDRTTDSFAKKFADKGVIVPAVVLSEAKAVLLKLDDSSTRALVKFFDVLADAGMIQAGEIGNERNEGRGSDKSAYEEIVELAEKKTAANANLSLTEAMDQVFRSEPELYARYRAESYAG